MSSAASSLMRSTGNLWALGLSLLASCHVSFFHQFWRGLKERGIDVEFDLQIGFSPHFCSVVHGLNQEELAKMDNAVMQSQGNLLHVDSVHYFQTTDFTHLHRMSNLIEYITSVYGNLGKDTKLMTLPQDGNPVHIMMIKYFTRSEMASSNMQNQPVSKS
jgi:hypothetical protein